MCHHYTDTERLHLPLFQLSFKTQRQPCANLKCMGVGEYFKYNELYLLFINKMVNKLYKMLKTFFEIQ